MIRCVERNKNKNGQITSYKLFDVINNNYKVIEADDLRQRMMRGFKVQNLKLSKTNAILLDNTFEKVNEYVDFCLGANRLPTYDYVN